MAVAQLLLLAPSRAAVFVELDVWLRGWWMGLRLKEEFPGAMIAGAVNDRRNSMAKKMTAQRKGMAGEYFNFIAGVVSEKCGSCGERDLKYDTLKITEEQRRPRRISSI